jgi:hypothetical protein
MKEIDSVKNEVMEAYYFNAQFKHAKFRSKIIERNEVDRKVLFKLAKRAQDQLTFKHLN